MPLSVHEFSRRLLFSGLMFEPTLTEFMSTFASTDQSQSGEQFGRWMVAQKKLTAYQAQRICDGTWKSLVLGNYVVLDKLGQGGMGIVFKALHRRMDRIVALKLLSPEVVKTPTLIDRFHREVKAAAKLE
ncbi:MAG: serine/threonine protein kinase, partial [Planctomycetes bacterium]|nr:serine/threonine protein kinase [Planctomycetota bacterium]